MKLELCLVAFMFVGASLYTMLNCTKCPPFTSYFDSLDNKQKYLYLSIVEERKKLAMWGLMLGLLLAFFYLFFMKNKINIFMNGCAFAGIVLLTQYLFYMLYPKTDYMVLHLKQEQMEGWLNVYKQMQYRYHMGMLLGVVGYFLLGMSL